MPTFTFKHHGYVVKRLSDGTIAYRCESHFGGPWSDCQRSIANISIDPRFRCMLRNAVKEVCRGQ